MFRKLRLPLIGFTLLVVTLMTALVPTAAPSYAEDPAPCPLRALNMPEGAVWEAAALSDRYVIWPTETESGRGVAAYDIHADAWIPLTAIYGLAQGTSTTIDYALDGHRLALVASGLVYLYDIQTGELKSFNPNISYKGIPYEQSGATLDGARVAWGYYDWDDSEIALVDFIKNKTHLVTFNDIDDGFVGLSGNTVVSIAENGSIVRLYDIISGVVTDVRGYSATYGQADSHSDAAVDGQYLVMEAEKTGETGGRWINIYNLADGTMTEIAADSQDGFGFRGIQIKGSYIIWSIQGISSEGYSMTEIFLHDLLSGSTTLIKTTVTPDATAYYTLMESGVAFSYMSWDKVDYYDIATQTYTPFQLGQNTPLAMAISRRTLLLAGWDGQDDLYSLALCGGTPEGDLLVNSDFEDSDDPPQKLPDDWKGVGALSDDRLRTDRPLARISYSAPNAFVFKGTEGDHSKLTQKVSLAGHTFKVDDLLTFRMMVRSNGALPGAQVGKALVKYTGGGQQVLQLHLPSAGTSASSGYTEISDQLTLTGTDIAKIQVQLFYNAPSGKVFMDDVRLSLSSAADSPVVNWQPLPAAPEFRGH